MPDKLTQTGSQASQELSRSLCQEQIIIDGVDVSGCTFVVCKATCKNTDCYFKQLARKTQECEELKDTLRTLTRGVVLPTPEQEVIDLTDRYLKALAPFQNEYFKGLDTTAIAELAKKSIRLTTENRKLETALDEIEEYQKRNCETCSFAETKKCDIHCQVFVILDIISKAKEEE